MAYDSYVYNSHRVSLGQDVVCRLGLLIEVGLLQQRGGCDFVVVVCRIVVTSHDFKCKPGGC
jgi:hypothetical protein